MKSGCACESCVPQQVLGSSASHVPLSITEGVLWPVACSRTEQQAPGEASAVAEHGTTAAVRHVKVRPVHAGISLGSVPQLRYLQEEPSNPSPRPRPRRGPSPALPGPVGAEGGAAPPGSCPGSARLGSGCGSAPPGDAAPAGPAAGRAVPGRRLPPAVVRGVSGEPR